MFDWVKKIKKQKEEDEDGIVVITPEEEIIEESKQAAAILGYNYKSGEWYSRSYRVFNKKYKSKKIKKEKKMGLIRKKIKGLFE